MRFDYFEYNLKNIEFKLWYKTPPPKIKTPTLKTLEIVAKLISEMLSHSFPPKEIIIEASNWHIEVLKGLDVLGYSSQKHFSK